MRCCLAPAGLLTSRAYLEVLGLAPWCLPLTAHRCAVVGLSSDQHTCITRTQASTAFKPASASLHVNKCNLVLEHASCLQASAQLLAAAPQQPGPAAEDLMSDAHLMNLTALAVSRNMCMQDEACEAHEPASYRQRDNLLQRHSSGSPFGAQHGRDQRDAGRADHHAEEHRGRVHHGASTFCTMTREDAAAGLLLAAAALTTALEMLSSALTHGAAGPSAAGSTMLPEGVCFRGVCVCVCVCVCVWTEFFAGHQPSAADSLLPLQVPYNVSVVSSNYLTIDQVFGLTDPTFDYSTGTATATAANYWDLLWPQSTNSVSLGMVVSSLTTSTEPQQVR